MKRPFDAPEPALPSTPEVSADGRVVARGLDAMLEMFRPTVRATPDPAAEVTGG